MATFDSRRLQSILLLALGGAAAQALLWIISEPPVLFSDFYKAYYPAAELIWIHGRSAPWPFTEVGAGGFVNLPVFAWVFTPLVPLGDEWAGWAFLFLGVASTAGTWLLLTRLGGGAPGYAASLAWLFLVNGPLVNSLREGNTTHFILLLLVIALILLERGAGYSAGVVLGICAVIKLPLLLFGAYFLLRRRWSVVAGGATAIAGAMLLSAAAFGVESNLQWWHACIAPFLGRAIPAFNVQSIDGFLIRLQTGVHHLQDWTPHAPPLPHTLTRSAIVVTMLGTFAWLALRNYSASSGNSTTAERSPRHLDGSDYLEFAMVPALAVVTSPVSWSHYYLLLLLPWGLWLGGRLAMPDDAMTRWLMRGSVALASLPVVFRPIDSGWLGDILARTIVSVWLFGGLLLLLALFRGAWLTAPTRLNIERLQSQAGLERR